MTGFSKLLIALTTIFVAAHAADINIVIGAKNALTFTPSTVEAAVGDKIIWKVSPDSKFPHDVIQSDSDSCTKSSSGFDSGLPLKSDGFSWEVTENVKPSTTIYYFCNVANHCASGMKGVIKIVESTGKSNSTTSTPGNSTEKSNSTTSTPGNSTEKNNSTNSTSANSTEKSNSTTSSTSDNSSTSDTNKTTSSQNSTNSTNSTKSSANAIYFTTGSFGLLVALIWSISQDRDNKIKE
ncbi:hypothetical protein G9A89_020466 [Geosiphon pyriformis]|nr:hypothetical protein G9A89_020466 [Geosiphon pyriformis]